jgi:hypothetical protein
MLFFNRPLEEASMRNASLAGASENKNESSGMFESPTGLRGLPSHQSLAAEIIPDTSLGQEQGPKWDDRYVLMKQRRLQVEGRKAVLLGVTVACRAGYEVQILRHTSFGRR